MKTFKQVSRLVNVDIHEDKDMIIDHIKNRNHLLLCETKDKDLIILAVDGRDNLCVVTDFTIKDLPENL